ncbi:LOW QUALITY PROTEIN: olfactory receptor 51A7-like [Bos mutus]|uniref:LOW QUALITY PROTEIN: olfactory receptor 51A7-like n=1 Tax=Bos mutus TaxID=72004 RepID=UPI0038B4ABFB
MHYFLSMLSISDLGLSLSFSPITLGLFLFGVHGIHAATCFAQEFFIHLFTVTEASVLLVMAFDQYVAMHHPLRYSTILTSSQVIKTGVLLTSKNIMLILPLPFLLQRLTYCHQNLLLHSYCLHQGVMKVACSDNRVNVVYGLCATLSSILDLLFITFSYMMILKIVLAIATPRGQPKALNTHISHICAVLIFCVPVLSAAMLSSPEDPALHQFASGVSPMTHILMADVFLLVPLLMNPIVSCVKTHQIRKKVMGKFCSKRSLSMQ